MINVEKASEGFMSTMTKKQAIKHCQAIIKYMIANDIDFVDDIEKIMFYINKNY